jgi:hypothetical protein
MSSEGRGLSKPGRGLKIGGGVEKILPKGPPKFSRGLSYFRPPRQVRCATKKRYVEYQTDIFSNSDSESCSTITEGLFQVKGEHFD